VFFDNPPAGDTHLLNNAQDVLAMPMFRDGLTDVNVTDPAMIDKAKQDIASIAEMVGDGMSFDHHDYFDLPAGDSLLHQSWSGNVSDAVVFLEDKSDADGFSYYWPGTDGYPANVDNDTIVLLKSGKAPVLAHLLADYLLDNDNAMANFVNMTGYQTPVAGLAPQTMVSSGIVPKHLSAVIVAEEDFDKGLRELELPTDADALWQQAFAELKAGV
jgi:spermidine/putrescine transport system substrate-binding protein